MFQKFAAQGCHTLLQLADRRINREAVRLAEPPKGKFGKINDGLGASDECYTDERCVLQLQKDLCDSTGKRSS